MPISFRHPKNLQTCRLNAVSGLVAVLFVWLSVLAPALHQHQQTRQNLQTVQRASSHYDAPTASADFPHAQFAPDACLASDDLCSLCDYLTTTAFAPPPALACDFVRTGGLRGSPALVGFSAPLLSRAFSQVQLRGPPASA